MAVSDAEEKKALCGNDSRVRQVRVALVHLTFIAAVGIVSGGLLRLSLIL